jgi:hypothetical protein
MLLKSKELKNHSTYFLEAALNTFLRAQKYEKKYFSLKKRKINKVDSFRGDMLQIGA